MAAHGTGVTLATVEEQIVELRLATPGEGLLTLSAQKDPRLFSLAKVGLGSLGVVTDMKLRCVPLMRLLEKTACIDRSAVFNDHINRLADCRHVRYMWIPYTDTVVTVCSNPTEVAVAPVSVGSAFSQLFSATTPTSAVAVGGPAAQQMFDLLNKSRADSGVDGSMKGLSIDKMSVADLRSELLDATPLNLDVCSVSPAVDFTHSKAVNPQHVKAVNRAEAAYWRSSQGSREASSTEILGFDCGGEQLVYEV